MIVKGIHHEATFTIVLTEKELGTIVSALDLPHGDVCKHAVRNNNPHLNGSEEFDLYSELSDLLEEGAK